MTGRVNRHGWIVLSSFQSDDPGYCVDFFEDLSGKYGFELFRSDPEDNGAWTSTSLYGGKRFTTSEEAVEAARLRFPWLDRSK